MKVFHTLIGSSNKEKIILMFVGVDDRTDVVGKINPHAVDIIPKISVSET